MTTEILCRSIFIYLFAFVVSFLFLFLKVFVKGIDTKHFTSKIVSSLINDSLTLNGNSDIANVSLCKDNTQQLIRKIDQIESDEGIIITTGANVDESSTKRNVQKTGEFCLLCYSISIESPVSLISF